MKKQYQEYYTALCILLRNKEIENKYFSFTRSLLSIHNTTGWTNKQAKALHYILLKHKDKLEKHKIKHNAWIEPKIENRKQEEAWTAETKGNIIELSFFSKDSSLFYNAINDIKNIPNSFWDKNKRKWNIPFSTIGIARIKKMGFITDNEINNWYASFTKDKEKEEQSTQETIIKKIQKHKQLKKMRPFQQQGAFLIHKYDGRALLADEMGLGKTLQAISYIKLNPEISPILIITPANLKITWQREIQKWIHKESYIVDGSKKDKNILTNKTVIINYEIVKHHITTIMKMNPQCVILDECHKIKNSDAQQTKVVKKICRKAEKMIALSGTPILSRPIEIFNVLNLLRPEMFPSSYRFKQRYCDPQSNDYGVTYKGASNLDELHEILTNYVMIRRKKKDVLPELPEKRRQVIPFQIDNMQEYESAEENIIKYIYEQKGLEAAKRASRAETLVKFNQLKQLSTKGKIKECIEWINNFLLSDKKLVVFAFHEQTISTLMEHYEKIAVRLDGKTTKKQKQKSIDNFQTKKDIKLFIANIKAGEGIDLTASSDVAVIEFAWTPGAHHQAEDRIHRMTQKNKCMIYYLIAQNTIEEYISELIDEKQRIIDNAIDGEESINESLLMALMEKALEKAHKYKIGGGYANKKVTTTNNKNIHNL